MTNVEGLWMLFVMLSLLAACLVVAVGLLGLLGWQRSRSDRGSTRWSAWGGIVGLGISALSWGFALVFITPSGIVSNLLDLNPVLLVTLLGYTLPLAVGIYCLTHESRRDTRASAHQ